MASIPDVNENSLLDKETAKKYLELHQLSGRETKHVFVATPLDKRTGGTVLRQQVRALNLAYALYQSADDSKVDQFNTGPIAVIGGGFAGVTLAAGLLRSGFEVHLFEQRPELCHLQSGCEIRTLHPTVYDWPHPESTRRDARLPLLNWSAGTAGDVARSVLRQFSEISKNSDGKYHEYLGANARIAGTNVCWDNAAPPRSDTMPRDWLGRGGSHQFSYIFVTVGFGIETGVSDATTVSYWRNDRFGQPRPGTRSERPESILITGTGDGALIDLIRTCLRGYKQDALIDDLFGDCLQLVTALGKFREEYLAQPKLLILKQLRNLLAKGEHKNEVERVKVLIRERRRHDTHVVLHGRSHSLDQQLCLSGRSFLNVLVACLLYDTEAFSYISGKINTESLSSDGYVSVDDYGKIWPDEVIIRHGTDRNAILMATGLSKEDIDSLRKRQRDAPESWQLTSLWPPGWWSAPRNSAPNDDATHWTERIPRTELVAATILAKSVCAELIASGKLQGHPFRTTLHRVLHYASRNNLACYQQITAYHGTASPERMSGKAGRVFRSSADSLPGAVGITISTGKGFIAHQASDSTMWNSLWNKLIRTAKNNSQGPHHNMVVDKVSTVATVPVSFTTSEETAVLYIFYIDVEEDVQGNRPDRSIVHNVATAAAHTFGESVAALTQMNLDDGRLFSRSIAATPQQAGLTTNSSDDFHWLYPEYEEVAFLFEVNATPLATDIPRPLELCSPH